MFRNPGATLLGVIVLLALGPVGLVVGVAFVLTAAAVEGFRR